LPSVFLSPSSKDYNKLFGHSATEQYYMNVIADYMEFYLKSSHIEFSRNNKTMNAAESVRLSNEKLHDIHISLHTNSIGSVAGGGKGGIEVFYNPNSPGSKAAADIFARNLIHMCAKPDYVSILPNTSFVELKSTTSPSIYISLGNRDDFEDCEWIKNNAKLIAANLSLSITEYLGIKAEEQTRYLSGAAKKGIVNTDGKLLNLRTLPSFEGKIIGKLKDKTNLEIKDQKGDWALVSQDEKHGYALVKYIMIIG